MLQELLTLDSEVYSNGTKLKNSLTNIDRKSSFQVYNKMR